jgi:hypothetical protein
MPDEMRPDKAHLYISHVDSQIASIMVDPEYPDAWAVGIGKAVVEGVRKGGRHAVVLVGDQVTFLPGYGVQRPEKLVLDWEL